MASGNLSTNVPPTLQFNIVFYAFGLNAFDPYLDIGNHGLAYGTSLSSANAAGVAALVIEAYRSAHNGQFPTAAKLKHILIKSADDRVGPTTDSVVYWGYTDQQNPLYGYLAVDPDRECEKPGKDDFYGKGRLNAKAAIMEATGGSGFNAPSPGEYEEVVEAPEIPGYYALGPSHPNPFSVSTILKYQLPKSSFVEINVYDIRGRLVETLTRENTRPGYYSIEWDASEFSSGMYLYRMKAGEFSGTGRCLVLR